MHLKLRCNIKCVRKKEKYRLLIWHVTSLALHILRNKDKKNAPLLLKRATLWEHFSSETKRKSSSVSLSLTHTHTHKHLSIPSEAIFTPADLTVTVSHIQQSYIDAVGPCKVGHVGRQGWIGGEDFDWQIPAGHCSFFATKKKNYYKKKILKKEKYI